MFDRPAAVNAARYAARERQKRELRRERDALVVNLCSDFGEQGLAERLGVTRPAADKLVADARERLRAEASAPAESEVGASGRGVDPDRWAEADAHYEALGSAPSLIDRRRAASSSTTR